MGKDKTSSSTQSTQTVERTAEQKELEQILLGRERKTDAAKTQSQLSALDLSNTLLTGGKLPGELSGLTGGINEEVTSGIVQNALQDIRPGLQSSGLIDSGIRAELEMGAAKDIRLDSERFNINNLMQMLNLASGNAAQSQALGSQGTGQLGNLAMSAAGRTSDSSTHTAAMNPFLKSFQQSAGSSFGSSLGQGGGDAATAAIFGCWVAAEIFGGWLKPKTVSARYYVNFIAPTWFKDFYLKHGEKIASFIKDKPVFKAILKPLFEQFARLGGK